MRLSESQLRRIIREELETTDPSVNIDLDLLAKIYSGYENVNNLKEDRLLRTASGTKEKLSEISRDDIVPVVDMVVDVIRRAAEMPAGPAVFNYSEYYFRLRQKLNRAGRNDVSKKLPAQFNMKEGEDPSFKKVYLAVSSLSSFHRFAEWGATYANTGVIEKMAEMVELIQADPDILRVFFKFFDSIPKFARFFESGEYEDYEEQIISLIEQGDFNSLMQAADLVDMLLM
jgi:hypothetical protein